MPGVVVVQDESAADRVVGALTQHFPVPVRREGHAIGVERQRTAAIEDQIFLSIE